MKLVEKSSGISYFLTILATSKKRSPSMDIARVRSTKKPQLLYENNLASSKEIHDLHISRYTFRHYL